MEDYSQSTAHDDVPVLLHNESLHAIHTYEQTEWMFGVFATGQRLLVESLNCSWRVSIMCQKTQAHSQIQQIFMNPYQYDHHDYCLKEIWAFCYRLRRFWEPQL